MDDAKKSARQNTYIEMFKNVFKKKNLTRINAKRNSKLIAKIIIV